MACGSSVIGEFSWLGFVVVAVTNGVIKLAEMKRAASGKTSVNLAFWSVSWPE